MFRTALAILTFLIVPVASFAAGGGAGGSGGGGHGGGTSTAGRGNVGGGLVGSSVGLLFAPNRDPAAGFIPFNYHGDPGYPMFGIWGGFGGNMSPSLYYSLYGYPPTPAPRTMPTPAARGLRRTPSAPPPPIALSNEYPATLYLQLPAPGVVWANGGKSEGKPTSEWTLTSPVIKPGQNYTFDVKANWEVDGKPYEYTRTVVLDGGAHSRITVLAGSPVAK